MSRIFSLSLLCIASLPSQLHAQDRLRQLLPSDESVARYGLVRKWYAFAPVDGKRETIQNVSIVGDQLHLHTSASRLHVLDAESGRLLWSAQLGVPVPNHFGSGINSNSVFVISGSQLYRLSREDGSQLWSLRLPQAPNAAPAADEEHVIVSTLAGRIYVYNVNTKETKWFYQTNGSISLPAVVIDEKFACASEDGKMYVFAVENRNPTLRFQTDAPVSAPLAVWGRAIMVPSEDTNLYSVDVRNGETLWRYAAGSEIHQPATVVDNEVFVLPDDGGMHVVNAETGARIWRHPRVQDFMAASKDRVYGADKYGQLLIMDRATGRQIGVWNASEFEFRARNDINDRLYLVSTSGMIVCLHERQNEKPLVHEKVQPPPTGGDIPKSKPGDTQ